MSGRLNTSRGFTLVEMLVVAPIVILFIGGMIYLMVSLTGETLASRSEDALAYDLQQAFARIEEDTATSERFLAATNIPLASTGQGYGDTTTTNSTTNFTNVAVGGGSPASLILQTYALSGNPSNPATRLVYLANAPNDCTTPTLYAANTAMTLNVVYFTDANNTLWRRTLMPANYNSGSYICGTAPWQLPSCISGYAASRTFCKTSDEKIAEGVTFSFAYYASASSSTADTTAVNAGATESARNTALLATKTVRVTITTAKTVAGRDISQTGSAYMTRISN